MSNTSCKDRPGYPDRIVFISVYSRYATVRFSMPTCSPGVICAHCQSLLSRPNDPLDIDYTSLDRSHIDVQAESIRQAADRGCPICVLCRFYLRSLPPEQIQSAQAPLMLSLYRSILSTSQSGVKISFPREGFIQQNLYLHYPDWSGPRALQIELRRCAKRSKCSCIRLEPLSLLSL